MFWFRLEIVSLDLVDSFHMMLVMVLDMIDTVTLPVEDLVAAVARTFELAILAPVYKRMCS